jgi:hypothetical protein
MGRKIRCKNCGEPIAKDGYGDLIHEDTGMYACAEDNKRIGKVAE